MLGIYANCIFQFTKMGRSVRHMQWSPTGGCVGLSTKTGDIEVVHFVVPERYQPSCGDSMKNFFAGIFGGDKKVSLNDLG